MQITRRDKVYALLISIVVCIFVLQKCSHKKELDSYRGKLLSMSIDNKNYVKEIDENDKEIATQSQLILTQKEALDKIGDLVDKYKKVDSYLNFTTETRIDSILVPYEVEVVKWIPSDSSITDLHDYIKTPLSFTKETEWYAFNGKVKTNGLFLDSIKFFNKSMIVVGTESQGLFKKPLPIVSIKNDNPFTSVTSMQNIQVEDRRRFYDKKGFWLGAGVCIGFLPTILNLVK